MNPATSLGGVTCDSLSEKCISKLRDEVWRSHLQSLRMEWGG